MNSSSDSKYKKKNFNKLYDACVEKGYEVVIKVHKSEEITIPVICVTTGKQKQNVVDPALVPESDTIEKASQRLYIKLLREKKIEA